MSNYKIISQLNFNITQNCNMSARISRYMDLIFFLLGGNPQKDDRLMDRQTVEAALLYIRRAAHYIAECDDLLRESLQ